MFPFTNDESINSAMYKTANANALHESFLLAKQGTDWKESVQRYEINELKFIREAQKKIYAETYRPTQTKSFILHERGHVRLIRPHTVGDRVVYKSFNKNVLLPNVRPLLIYDNGASLKGKGLQFSRERFELHLRKAWREYGPGACVLFIDFSKYFDNIDHDAALKEYSRFLNDSEKNFIRRYFEACRVDVSYMSEEQIREMTSTPYNSLKHAMENHEARGERFLNRSVGIGSENAQTTGIFLPYRMDNFVKIVKGVKYYGRYMDDSYLIMRSKDEAKAIYKEITEICGAYRIFINHKKTRYNKITDWLVFLKINYRITESGRIIKKVSNAAFRREHRRLTKYYLLQTQGRISTAEVMQAYKSWRGGLMRYHSKARIYKMDRYFISLFNVNERLLK